MKKKRFTEGQIIGILREQEAGAKAADLARICGFGNDALQLESQVRRDGRSVAHLRADGPVASSTSTASPSAIRPGDQPTRSFARNCANSPTPADASVIGGCWFCCGRRERRRARTASIGSTARKAYGQEAPRSSARCRNTGADPCRGEGERTLVPRLCPRPARLRPAVPFSERRRRRDARMYGGDPGHVDLGQTGRAQVDDVDRKTRQARNDRLEPWDGVHLETPSCRGRARTGSSGITSRRASPCRTASAKASTGVCATNCSTRRCSSGSTMPERRSPLGRTNTITNARIPPSAK